jgi:hypothetical protein
MEGAFIAAPGVLLAISLAWLARGLDRRWSAAFYALGAATALSGIMAAVQSFNQP